MTHQRGQCADDSPEDDHGNPHAKERHDEVPEQCRPAPGDGTGQRQFDVVAHLRADAVQEGCEDDTEQASDGIHGELPADEDHPAHDEYQRQHQCLPGDDSAGALADPGPHSVVGCRVLGRRLQCPLRNVDVCADILADVDFALPLALTVGHDDTYGTHEYRPLVGVGDRVCRAVLCCAVPCCGVLVVTGQVDPGSGWMDGFKSRRRVRRCMNAGDRVRVDRSGQTFEGVVLPSSTPDHIVVKLESGYNVGIDRDEAAVDVLESDVYDVESAQSEGTSEIEFDDSLPTISLISTGGTIASTVDYRTGAVTAQFDAEDVLRAVPDLAGLANYRGRVVANILSENMTTDVWQDLAATIHEEIEAGADGVVVMHGTDTMQFTASAIAFMLETPVPIVFTGSQRSADRPSSDNVMNAVCAVEAAKSDCAEVLICMHENESDDRCALHRGTRARKNHTSRRDAFETVGASPLGTVEYETRDVSFRREYDERDE
ncbi:MAG: hypothetical protein ACI8XM_002283, partial [Haloarculaceae archaeon]